MFFYIQESKEFLRKHLHRSNFINEVTGLLWKKGIKVIMCYENFLNSYFVEFVWPAAFPAWGCFFILHRLTRDKQKTSFLLHCFLKDSSCITCYDKASFVKVACTLDFRWTRFNNSKSYGASVETLLVRHKIVSVLDPYGFTSYLKFLGKITRLICRDPYGLYEFHGLTKAMFISYSSNLPIKNRSSVPEVFLGKGVLKIWSKFTGEHP